VIIVSGNFDEKWNTYIASKYLPLDVVDQPVIPATWEPEIRRIAV
jgi:hypothetical protein